MELRLSLNADGLMAGFNSAPQVLLDYLVPAVWKGAEAIQREARGNHHFTTRTGTLENAVQALPLSDVRAVVRLETERIPYAASIHDGSQPHPILPKNANLSTQRSLAGKFGVPKGSRLVLRWPVGAGFAFARFVNHPGTKPDQFLYAAAEAKREEVQDNINYAVWTALREAGL